MLSSMQSVFIKKAKIAHINIWFSSEQLTSLYSPTTYNINYQRDAQVVQQQVQKKVLG